MHRFPPVQTDTARAALHLSKYLSLLRRSIQRAGLEAILSMWMYSVTVLLQLGGYAVLRTVISL